MKEVILRASALVALLVGSEVSASEIKVIAATPLTSVIEELGPKFERANGHRLITKFVSGPIVKQEIDRGEAFDVALSITPVIDELTKDGKLIPDTRVDVAYAGVGMGVRSGAPKPDISTPEAVKRALLNAKSVAHSATGASGDHFKNMLQRLGIADEMIGKLKPMPADKIAQAVPSGEAELIVVTASIAMVPGTDFVGLLPKELQFFNSFAGGVGSSSKEVPAGKALLKALTAPGVEAVMRSKGMEPGAPEKP